MRNRDPHITQGQFKKLTKSEQLSRHPLVRRGQESAEILVTVMLHRDAAAEHRHYVQAGLAARNELVECMVPWGISLARRWARRDEDLDDYIQAAMLGLIQAADRWAPARGLLTTCCAVWVRNAIQNLQKKSGVIHTPNYLFEAAIEKAGYSETQASLKELAQKARKPMSLDRSHVDNPHLFDSMVEKDQLEPLQELIALETKHNRSELLQQQQDALQARMRSKLLPREEEIVRSRLRGERLHEIGRRLGISKERVRQLETRALKKLGYGELPSLAG